jgi:lysophospholipase L1-like esterase
MRAVNEIFQIRKFLKLFLVALSIFSLCNSTAFAVGTPPTTAPVISLVTRGVDFLKIDFANGRAQGATKYQYSLDAGATWFDTVAKGDKVTVKPVPRSKRAQVSLRGVNEFGFGPVSAVYKTTRALFIGASITAGVGVSGNSWAKMSASALGWQYTNLALSGTGFMHPLKNGKDCSTFANFASQSFCGVAWNPDIVIVSGGSNDCQDVNTKQGRLQAQVRIQSTLAFTKSYFPNAEIIVTPVISPAGSPCLKQISKWIADSSASTGVSFVDGADSWLSGQKQFASLDGQHPNLAGHTYVASQFVAWYKNLHK